VQQQMRQQWMRACGASCKPHGRMQRQCSNCTQLGHAKLTGAVKGVIVGPVDWLAQQR
jgi:hypothetical protein